MKKTRTILLWITMLMSTIITSQVPTAEELVGVHTVTEVEMNGIVNPITGTLLYNSDNNSVSSFNGTTWQNLVSDGSDTKLIANSNVTITGSGTTADPYMISSPKPTLTQNPNGTYTFSNGVDPDIIIITNNTPIVSQSSTSGGCSNEFQVNETKDLIIQGDYFDGGCTVVILGQTVNSVTINSATQITANVTAGNTTGGFDIQVTTNGMTGTLPNGFNIKAALTTHTYANSEIILSSQMTYASGTLQRTAGTGWNRQGYSTIYGIPAANEGHLDLTSGPNNRYRMVGLDNSPAAGVSYTTIDYALYLAGNNRIYIYENGSNKGNKTTYVSGDQFKINVDCDGTVTYFKNGTVIYTSTTKATNTLYPDSCFYNSPNSGISNISITY